MEVSKRFLAEFPKESEKEREREREREKMSDDSEPSKRNSTSIKGGGQQGTTCKALTTVACLPYYHRLQGGSANCVLRLAVVIQVAME
jgi:hypothetical protein